MKKLFSFILSLFVLLCLTGCFANTSEISQVTDTNGKSKVSFKLNETAVFENVHYTVTNVEYSKGDDWDTPSEGKNYVVITINIENKSDEKISYNTLDWTMVNSKGQEDSEAFTTIDTDTNLGSGDLTAGGSKTGTIVFEEDINEPSLKLLYYSNMLFDEEETIEFIIK